ncbi:PGF-CTERM-anchored ABC transporter substrate-binding protein [Halopiger djelfimassiliensis]|uniref:PGF-CTERM-anchored ABC transporter substrate-binding protein n=1 Tax=Halopiger djelfimassiliensis TaxID=1293047 RepID=UPI0006780991|nr:PGF-CTERM-anchored ABC transporter substrate-binding protein [Halopiger djelfimassiliensis]
MRRHVSVLLAALLVVSSFAPVATAQSDDEPGSTVECAFPLEVTDATGETITLEEAPESVVALQPSDAQTMFEIGAEDRLVGMPDNPATSGLESGDRTAVTDGYEVLSERVVDLDPDLVLAANVTRDGTIDQLRSAGLTVYHFADAESLADVRENVATTGRLTDECDGAAETIDWMDEQLGIVERALEGEDRPLAYYAMGDDGQTAGTETFIHEVLTTAGVENVAERAGISSWEQLNPETVVDENPDWIIYPDHRDEPPIPASVEATTAYRDDNVLAVDANRISQPAPQVVSAVVEIVETIHPDAYEQASADLETTDAGDERGDAEGGENAIPGFGVPAAVVALLAVGFVARRR